jgi:hypothetical protein
VARGNPCLGTSTVRASKAGFEPALSLERSIRNLHHQRLVEPRDAANRITKQILSRRFERRAASANP